MAKESPSERQWDRCLFCQSPDKTQLRDPLNTPSLKVNHESLPSVYNDTSQRIVELIQLKELKSNVIDMSTNSDLQFRRQ